MLQETSKVLITRSRVEWSFFWYYHYFSTLHLVSAALGDGIWLNLVWSGMTVPIYWHSLTVHFRVHISGCLLGANSVSSCRSGCYSECLAGVFNLCFRLSLILFVCKSSWEHLMTNDIGMVNRGEVLIPNCLPPCQKQSHILFIKKWCLSKASWSAWYFHCTSPIVRGMCTNTAFSFKHY